MEIPAVKQKVKDIANEIYGFGYQQILIDFVQDDVEEVLNAESITRDDVGALAYEASLLLDVYNPKFKKDIDLLNRLDNALRHWENDIEANNQLLGIPKES